MKYKIFPGHTGKDIQIVIGRSSIRTPDFPQEVLDYIDEQINARIVPLYEAKQAATDHNEKWDINTQMQRERDEIRNEANQMLKRMA